MLDAAVDMLRDKVGIRTSMDLGRVFEGKLGVGRVAVSAKIETWSQMLYFCIRTDFTAGPSFRSTSVVKWPYGRTSIEDGLPRVLLDLDAVIRAPLGVPLTDPRGWLGRTFDRWTGRVVLGEYRFLSPIDPNPRFYVTALLIERGNERLVTLTEGTRGRGFILTQLPQAAFVDIAAAVRSRV